MKGTRKRVHRLYLLALAFAALAVVPFFTTGFLAHMIIMAIIYVSMAQAWNLLAGYTGEISFGHAAFFGIGAYTVALNSYYNIGIPYGGDILVGGGMAALFALIISYPLLRIRGLYFAVVTLALSEILRMSFHNLHEYTRGAGGIYLPVATPYSLTPYYLTGVTLGFAILLFLYFIVKSRIGLAFISIRDNAQAAAMMGVNTLAYRILSLVLSAFFTGLVGGYFTHYRLSAVPGGAFDLMLNFKMIIAAVFGGMGTFAGPIVGGLIVLALEEIGRTFFLMGYLLLLSVLLAVTVLFMPGGIVGVLTRQVPMQNPFSFRRRSHRAPA